MVSVLEAPPRVDPYGVAEIPSLDPTTLGAAEQETVALSWQDGRLSRGELCRRVNGIAAWLQASGVGPEKLVALRLSGPDMVLGILAVWQAGGAFLPLDPRLQGRRLELILADAQPHLVLSELDTVEAALAPVEVTPDHLAYVIYTSGSTGRPKGVGVTHAGLPVIRKAARKIMRLTPQDCLLQASSPSFDGYLINLLVAMDAGARLHLPEPHFIADLAEVVRRNGVTVLNLPPSALSTLDDREPLGGLRQIMVAGEVCPASLAARWATRCRFLNQYGPTEATIWSTVHEASPSDAQLKTLPIGRPLPGVGAHLLDDQLRPAAEGELYLSGRVLARGYLNRPEQTAAAFIRHPNGSRLYRTGDRVRRRRDGALDYLGRVDDQVKLRGFRVEPGEVEAVLTGHPHVREAVVTLHGDGATARLVAHIVSRNGADLEPRLLRDHCTVALPDYMVPAEFVLRNELPRTLTGKVDRVALSDRRSSTVDPLQPAETIEQAITGIWAAVLGRTVGVDEDFFDSGGHSLAAAQVVTQLRRKLGLEIPTRRLFDHPTLSEFVPAVLAKREQGQRIQKLASGAAPLSFAQERSWLTSQLSWGVKVTGTAWAVRLRGEPAVPVWERAVSELERRHDVLRTVFDTEGGVLRAVARRPGPVSLAAVDLSTCNDPLDSGHRLARELAERPWRLEAEPPVRWRLARLSNEDSLLLVALHPVAADDCSRALLLRELSRLAAGAPLPEVPVHYADFAIWQRDQDRRADLDYWSAKLRGAPRALALPFDRKPTTESGWAAGLIVHDIAGQLRRRVADLAQAEAVSELSVLLSVFAQLMARECGEEDLVIALPVADRDRPELHGVVGPLADLVPVRLQATSVPEVAAALSEAMEHAHVPFGLIAEELGGVREAGRPALAQAAFELGEPTSDSGLDVADLSRRLSDVDIRLTLVPTIKGWSARWTFRSELLEMASVERLHERYVIMLERSLR